MEGLKNCTCRNSLFNTMVKSIGTMTPPVTQLPLLIILLIYHMLPRNPVLPPPPTLIQATSTVLLFMCFLHTALLPIIFLIFSLITQLPHPPSSFLLYSQLLTAQNTMNRERFHRKTKFKSLSILLKPFLLNVHIRNKDQMCTPMGHVDIS